MRAMACVALPMSAATAVQPMRYGLIKESHESWVALTPGVPMPQARAWSKKPEFFIKILETVPYSQISAGIARRRPPPISNRLPINATGSPEDRTASRAVGT